MRQGVNGTSDSGPQPAPPAESSAEDQLVAATERLLIKGWGVGQTVSIKLLKASDSPQAVTFQQFVTTWARCRCALCFVQISQHSALLISEVQETDLRLLMDSVVCPLS